jgi:hypothetical protein
MKTLLALVFAVLLVGCVGLHPKNNAAEDVGEVALRTALFPVTLGLSEAVIKHEREQEAAKEYEAKQAREERRAYRDWYRSLPPEEKDREDRRSAREDQMLLQQAIIANQNMNAAMNRVAPMFTMPPPAPMYQPSHPAMEPTYRPRTNCRSMANGPEIYTNCY